MAARTTRDLCQDCWQDRHPDDYPPTMTRYGTCSACESDALVTRSTSVGILADVLPVHCLACSSHRYHAEPMPGCHACWTPICDVAYPHHPHLIVRDTMRSISNAPWCEGIR